MLFSIDRGALDWKVESPTAPSAWRRAEARRHATEQRAGREHEMRDLKNGSYTGRVL